MDGRRSTHDLAVFHHEVDLAKVLDVLEWVSRHRDQVSAQALADRASHLVDPQQFGGIHRHGLENVDGRHSRFPPYREVVQHEVGAGAAGHVDHGVAAESHANADAVSATKTIHDFRSE